MTFDDVAGITDRLNLETSLALQVVRSLREVSFLRHYLGHFNHSDAFHGTSGPAHITMTMILLLINLNIEPPWL